jgi:hypothetical protein
MTEKSRIMFGVFEGRRTELFPALETGLGFSSGLRKTVACEVLDIIIK